LLEAVHQYVSDFYKRQGLEKVCSKKFDETALLAMGRELSSLMLILGILIEELVNEYIGMEGHKVFIEQSVEAHDDDDDSEDSGDTRNRNVELDTEYDDNTDDREEEEEILDDESSDF
jgi:hypothetical protein